MGGVVSVLYHGEAALLGTKYDAATTDLLSTTTATMDVDLVEDTKWKMLPTMETATECYCECYGFKPSQLKKQHVELLSILGEEV
jgi:hypothetical protein